MKYDTHVHTHYSYCSINRPESLLKIAKKKGLNGIAITDHHTLKGANKTKKLNNDKNFEVIIGEEITTEYGDILALYLQKEIKVRSLFEVIDEARSQDSILIVPHPFRSLPWLRFRYPLDKLVKKVHAVEVFNSRNFGLANKRAQKYVEDMDLACTGGSDAHIPLDIGRGYTIFKDSLRTAIKKRKTLAGGTTHFSMVSGGVSFIAKRIFTPIRLKKKWV